MAQNLSFSATLFPDNVSLLLLDSLSESLAILGIVWAFATSCGLLKLNVLGSNLGLRHFLFFLVVKIMMCSDTNEQD